MRTLTFATLFALAGALGLCACDEKDDAKAEAKAEAKKDEKKADAKTDVKADAKEPAAEARAGAGGPAGDVKAVEPAPAPAAGGTVALTKLGLVADAPPGTAAGDAMMSEGVMVQGEDLAAIVDVAADSAPKTEEEAKKEAATHEPRNWKSEKLADGWIVTFDNEGDLGPNFFVQSRREIGGKAYSCESTTSSVEQQAAAVALCKSLRQ